MFSADTSPANPNLFFFRTLQFEHNIFFLPLSVFVPGAMTVEESGGKLSDSVKAESQAGFYTTARHRRDHYEVPSPSYPILPVASKEHHSCC